LRKANVLVDRNFFGAALHVEGFAVGALIEPAAERVAQELAALREGHADDLAQERGVELRG
jgi:hypothetical protein